MKVLEIYPTSVEFQHYLDIMKTECDREMDLIEQLQGSIEVETSETRMTFTDLAPSSTTQQ